MISSKRKISFKRHLKVRSQICFVRVTVIRDLKILPPPHPSVMAVLFPKKKKKSLVTFAHKRTIHISLRIAIKNLSPNSQSEDSYPPDTMY